MVKEDNQLDQFTTACTPFEASQLFQIEGSYKSLNVTTADSRYLNKVITTSQLRAPSDGCFSSALGAKTASVLADVKLPL
jgi:hypothetical protein